MNWGSLSEFLDMGGYGFYVWGSYLVTLVIMVWEVLAARRRKRTNERLLSRRKHTQPEVTHEAET